MCARETPGHLDMVCSERLGAWNILWWGVRRGRVALFLLCKWKENQMIPACNLLLFAGSIRSPLKSQLPTHLTHLQATFKCDGTCRRLIGVVDRHMRATDPFCSSRLDSLCLCPLCRHEETSSCSPDLCPRTHLVGRRVHLEKTGTFSCV